MLKIEVQNSWKILKCILKIFLFFIAAWCSLILNKHSASPRRVDTNRPVKQHPIALEWRKNSLQSASSPETSAENSLAKEDNVVSEEAHGFLVQRRKKAD